MPTLAFCNNCSWSLSSFPTGTVRSNNHRFRSRSRASHHEFRICMAAASREESDTASTTRSGFAGAHSEEGTMLTGDVWSVSQVMALPSCAGHRARRYRASFGKAKRASPCRVCWHHCRHVRKSAGRLPRAGAFGDSPCVRVSAARRPLGPHDEDQQRSIFIDTGRIG